MDLVSLGSFEVLTIKTGVLADKDRLALSRLYRPPEGVLSPSHAWTMAEALPVLAAIREQIDRAVAIRLTAYVESRSDLVFETEATAPVDVLGFLRLRTLIEVSVSAPASAGVIGGQVQLRAMTRSEMPLDQLGESEMQLIEALKLVVSDLDAWARGLSGAPSPEGGDIGKER